MDLHDRPMRHRAPAAIHGDAGTRPPPAVGAEVAFLVLQCAEEDVIAAIPCGDGPPPDVALLRLAEVAQDGAVAVRRQVRREREVAAVGGVLEEEAGRAVAQDDTLHLPRRVHHRAARAQGDAGPVVVGEEVRAPQGAPQPHVHPVGETIHRGRRWWWWCAGKQDDRLGFLALVRGGEGKEREAKQSGGVRCDGLAWAPGFEALKASAAEVGCCTARQLAGGVQ